MRFWVIVKQLFWLIVAPVLFGILCGFFGSMFGWIETKWFLNLYIYVLMPIVVYWCVVTAAVVSARGDMPTTGYVFFSIIGTALTGIWIFGLIAKVDAILHGGYIIYGVLYFYGIYILRDLWKKQMIIELEEIRQRFREMEAAKKDSEEAKG